MEELRTTQIREMIIQEVTGLNKMGRVGIIKKGTPKNKTRHKMEAMKKANVMEICDKYGYHRPDHILQIIGEDEK